MALFGKPKQSTERVPTSPLPASGEDWVDRYDEAVDTLAAILRVFGKLGFDVDLVTAAETDRRAEGWARHVLTGASQPDEPDAAAVRGAGRAWRHLKHWFGEHRKLEHELVERMRSLVWEMLNGIRRAFADDAAADGALRSRLERLRRLAEGGISLTELRQEVVATVGAIEQALADRQARHQDEMRTLGARLAGMKAELAAARHSAGTDALTKLFNRASFDEHIEATAQLADFTGEPVSLLMLDLDHFKKLNDEHGHQVGDRVLQAVANSFVRVASRKTDFVARYGGEEFAVVLGDTSLDGATRVAERVLAAIRKLSIEVAGRLRTLTVSIGLAERSRAEATAAWIARADRALYQAKEQGRDQLVVAASAQAPAT